MLEKKLYERKFGIIRIFIGFILKLHFKLHVSADIKL